MGKCTNFFYGGLVFTNTAQSQKMYFLKSGDFFLPKMSITCQCGKKIVFDGQRLVEFAVGFVDSVLHSVSE